MFVGIDVGSTTVKIAVVDPATKELLYSEYKRHNAEQAACVQDMLQRAHEKYPGVTFKL